ncbi:hypothetical protein BACSP_00396 [Bacillus sp. T2.9-1]|nr:hypothetical protein BACSP_00396 [Bacillus sp. T2.9-1]
MPFGISIHMLHVLQRGMVNRLQVNIKIIVFTSQNLEPVKLFIQEDKPILICTVDDGVGLQ